MVRAAASGAIDYTGADPMEKNWRIKHRLLLKEVHRQEEQKLLEHVHQHWCAFTGHGNLNDDSFKRVKTEVSDVLGAIQNVIFPWDKQVKQEAKNSTIDAETQNLVEVYKELVRDGRL
jgi:hypothetical protein